jgi:hypothetical protein
MCFSAEASFVASGTLAATSVAIARIPKERSEIPLSLFPAVFAVHQAIEGVLWLNHDGIVPDTYKPAAVFAYFLIAFVLWPVYVPIAAYMIERVRLRRWTILGCQLAGLWLGAALVASAVRYGVDAYVSGRSIAYSVQAPELFTPPYLVAVSIPFLVSSRRRLVFFGIALLASCAFAAVTASMATFPSVWCFWAAILSAALYLHFKTAHKGAVDHVDTDSGRAVAHA